MKSVGLVDVPPMVVTVIGTVPVPGGADAVMVVQVALTVTDPLATPPKVTEMSPQSPVPVMVTVLPPEGGPLDGEDPVMVGGPVERESL